MVPSCVVLVVMADEEDVEVGLKQGVKCEGIGKALV
jgi:hypothetical protein